MFCDSCADAGGTKLLLFTFECSKNSNMNFNQQVYDTSLSPEDEQLLRWWHKIYGRAAWGWGLFLVFLLPFTAMALFFFLQAAINLLAVLVFIPFELFFLWKIIDALRKMRMVSTAIGKGVKQVVTGRLQTLKVSNGNCLQYSIDNNVIKIIAPGPFTGLTGSYFLQAARVRLETVSLSAQSNILLGVQYPDIPPGKIDRQVISATSKENGASLINWAIAKYKEKKVITGTISEVMVVRYRAGKYSGIKTRCWYRVDKEMIPGSSINNDDLQPGDKACFAYFVNKKGERQSLIHVQKITAG
jgi:hypothetical protein